MDRDMIPRAELEAAATVIYQILIENVTEEDVPHPRSLALIMARAALCAAYGLPLEQDVI
jgi:hypothetical protein